MIELVNVWKTYQLGEVSVPVLRGVSLEISKGEMVAIMGASGSGKTTLLNIVGCLDPLDKGIYRLNHESIIQSDDDYLARLRSQHIGFVFQSFNLIPRINALRNVALPMIYSGVPAAMRRPRAIQALEQMGIVDRANHLPSQLSGGQQQRVAIARALVNQPKLLVADEPTGSLDSQTGAEIMRLFKQLNSNGMTIVMVTHETDIAAHAHRTILLKDGAIVG